MPLEKKYPGSAAQRREQERQQRERRTNTRIPGRGHREPTRGPMARKKDRSGLYLAIGALGLVVAFIVGLVVYNNTHQSTGNTSSPTRVPVESAIMHQVTNVKRSTWETVGTGSVNNPFSIHHGQPLLTGPNDHPQILYVGGEFCPYCAAERWAMINALSRFGTFTNLSQVRSAEYNIPTFSFYQSSYSSSYINFVPVEVKGNEPDPSGQSYVDLQRLSAEQQQIFTKYNASQSFPFVDIGNQYVAVGASYDPTILLDSSLNSWQNIANALSDPHSTASKAILGTANYMTAAICNLTNQQPGSVCASPTIQGIARTLGKASHVTHANLLAGTSADPLADRRRVLR